VSELSLARDGAVATVTLTRSERRNALDPATIEALIETFGALATDDDVRVVVLAGEGPVFCAGADLAWMARTRELSRDDNLADARRLARAFETVDTCPKAVVARVQGAALAGGSGLVACSDVAIASEGTIFGFTEVRIGILPAAISPYVLRAIGPGATRELFTTGRRVDASEALRLGLVHRVVADDELDASVGETVATFLESPPGAIAACKRLVRESAAAFALDDLPERIANARVSDEAREGVTAFLEKRRPSWSART